MPGLRRGEVATLAGVSVEYYTRLERGNPRGVSESVLDALARALQLDDTERMYLYSLARAAGPAPEVRARQRLARPEVRPSVARIVEGMPELPAYVMNNPAARRFYADWERMARFAVGALRIEAGETPRPGAVEPDG